MKGLILAAGRGSRMGERTNDRPKCMVDLLGQPLLHRQVAALRAGGVDQIGIVRGYRADSIAVDGVDYFENMRWASTNMVMSLACARQWLATAPVIVSYSDIFYTGDLVAQLDAEPGDLVVAYDTQWLSLWKRRFADPLSDAETFRTNAMGRLLEIGTRAASLEEIRGQYMGLLKFTPTAWQVVDTILTEMPEAIRDKLDMTSLLRLLLERDFPIATLSTSGQWGEVDSPSDITVYEAMVATGELKLDR